MPEEKDPFPTWLAVLISSALLYALLTFLFNCKPTTFYHDAQNPCTGIDSVMCADWMRAHPGEYERFKKRVKADTSIHVPMFEQE